MSNRCYFGAEKYTDDVAGTSGKKNRMITNNHCKDRNSRFVFAFEAVFLRHIKRRGETRIPKYSTKGGNRTKGFRETKENV